MGPVSIADLGALVRRRTLAGPGSRHLDLVRDDERRLHLLDPLGLGRVSTGGSSRRTLDPMAWNGGRRIGIVSTRLSGTDGVSLETAKWEAVLERLGY
jgi:hypothetical protein